MTTTETKPKRAALTEDEKAARLQAAQDTMTAEVAKLRTSDDWLRYLSTATKFHNYSWNNVFLLMAQAAERDMAEISHVAGFHAWLDLGRSVKKGERALKVFRPVLVKYKKTDKGYDPSNPNKRKVVGFTLTSVFDIQQTEGEPLPERPTFTYPSGEVPFGLLTALFDFAAGIGFPASMGITPGKSLGVTRKAEHDIVLSEEIADSDARIARTLIHEIAHALLHMEEDYDYATHRGIAETEAESVAYLVGTYFGIDMGEQSFHYVTGWSPDLETLLKVGDRVMKTARKITDAVDPDVQQVKLDAEPTSAPVEPVVAEPVAEPVAAEPEPVAEPIKVRAPRKPRKSAVAATIDANLKKQAEGYKAERAAAEARGAAAKAKREAAKAEPVAEPVAVDGPPVVGGAWALFA